MIKKETPADKLYSQGAPLDAQDIIQSDTIDTSSPFERMIDWDQELNTDEKTRFATCSAVSHYHYVKLSNVLLCDNILLRPDESAAVKDAARLLLQQSGKELNLWNKYVERCGKIGPMGDAQQEYYQVIWDQPNALATLLGIQHINLAADFSYRKFQNGDALFQEITNELVQYNETVYPEVYDILCEVIGEKSTAERLNLLRHAAQPIDLLQIIVQERSNQKVFNILGTTDMKLAYGTGKKIKDFYKEIGLTTGLIPGIS